MELAKSHLHQWLFVASAMPAGTVTYSSQQHNILQSQQLFGQSASLIVLIVMPLHPNPRLEAYCYQYPKNNTPK